jgi:hypothetical protein
MLTDEFPMMGNFDNDYAYGDYVCHCNRCGVDYHGPDHTLICFKCYSVQFMEELGEPVSLRPLALKVAIAVIIGIIIWL